MWSDNDTIEDLIGFRVHAELIRDVVGDDTILPVTIGVFGDWQSGWITQYLRVSERAQGWPIRKGNKRCS